MESYKITGIEKLHYNNGVTRLSGFRLKGVVGDVDIFVDGKFMPNCLRELLDENDYVKTGKEAEYFGKEIEWAEAQIGKTLQCESLLYRAFATTGEVSIL